MVQCKACSDIEGREKKLVFKLDSFIKHLELKKCQAARPKMKTKDYFVCPHNFHVQNEKLYGSKGYVNTIAIQVANGSKIEKKNLQFVAIFHLLQ